MNHLQLHALEADYKVFIQNNRDGFLIVGEKMNVKNCETMVNDLLNEVEVKVKLEKNEIHALLAHESHYRHMIEKEYHVNTRLADNETLLLIGGKNSVKQAEHAIHDLFKSNSLISSFIIREDGSECNSLHSFIVLREQYEVI